jgi:hypothetical protein
VEPAAQEEQVSLTERAPSHHRWRRAVLIVLGCLVAILLVEGLFLLQSRGNLQAGRDALTAARRQTVAGDLTSAKASFAKARDAFGGADSAAHGPLGTVARAVPWFGNSADTFAAMASAGVSLSDAGEALTGALAALPQGLGSLAPANGELPLERYAALTDAVEQARDGAAAAADTLGAAPQSFVPQVLARPRWDAQEQASRLAEDLGGVADLLRGSAAFAGKDGPMRYLVVSQNPAELRGTGGIWGAYAILTLENGRASVSPAQPTQTLRDFPAGRVPSPSEDYATNYEQFGGAGSWQNLNATPDFPAAAQAALANYELGEGEALDGVIAADPFALQALLAVTGPVRVPGIGSVTADTVVDVTTNTSYKDYRGPIQRKEVLGTVATDVLGRFLGMDEHGLARLRALGDAVGGGHLRIYSTNEDVQAGLTQLGVSGALDPPQGDYLGVTVNNGSGSKIDYYATRRITYDVTLGGDGEAIGVATAAIENDAPTHGQPRYVIGPYVDGAAPGDQIPLTNVWCGRSCSLISATRDGDPIALATGTENGAVWFQDYRTIPAGQTGELAVTMRSEDAWEGNSSGGSYTLTFSPQTTVQPTDLKVTIHAPSGTDIVWTNEPMAVDGGTAVWQGTPKRTLTLSVRFRAALPLRLVRDAARPIVGG